MTTKTKSQREPIVIWDDGEIWCKVDHPDSEYAWCGYHFLEDNLRVAPDAEVPDVITCPDCLSIIKAVQSL